MVKHFFKALTAFLVIIILVLVSFFVVNYFEQNSETSTIPADQVQVAK